jgi:DNA-binding XRE family transcriptional regulator
MLAVHMPAPKQRRRGFVLPREYLIALRILTGWTQEHAAELAEVTVSTWRDWEHGRSRIQGAAWRLLLARARLPSTWRPTSALCAYASTLVGSRCDVVQVARELVAVKPSKRVEPIAAWRARGGLDSD